MKYAVLLLALAAPAHADGLNVAYGDSEVMAPRSAWSGPYVALSYGRVTGREETVQCFKLGTPYACDDPVFTYYPEFKTEVRTSTETSGSAAGLLLGYRFDLGRVVPGVEVALYDGEAVPGVSLGLDLGGLLPYAHLDSDGAALGIEVKLSPRISAGVRGGENGAALTLGWAW